MITRLFQIMVIVIFSTAAIGTVHAESDRCAKLKKAAKFTNDWSAYDAECKGKKRTRVRTTVKTEEPIVVMSEPSGPKWGGIVIAIFFLSLILIGLSLRAYHKLVIGKLREENGLIAKKLDDLEKKHSKFVKKVKEEFEKRPVSPPTNP